MPAKTTTSAILAKHNQPSTTLQEHAKDETRYGLIRLPGGIVNGIARLTEIYVTEHEDGDNKGKLYFRAVGTVVEPLTVGANGQIIKVAGLQTSVVVGLYPKGKMTQSQSDGDFLNHLRLLAGPRSTDNVRSYADTIPIINAILAAKPYFRFSTEESAEVRNPDGSIKYEARVWERWHGTKGLEGYRPEPTANGTPSTKGMTDQSSAAAPTNRISNQPRPQDVSQPTEEITYRDDMDLDSLARRADPPENDQPAADLLTKFAADRGISKEAVDATPSWMEVVDMIRKAKKSDGAAATRQPAPASSTDDQPSWEPKVDDNYGYFPLTKTGKPSAKKVRCVVISVDLTTDTVELQNLDNKKVRYKGVDFNDLKDVD